MTATRTATSQCSSHAPVVTARSASSDSRIRRASDFRLRSSTTRRIPASLEPLLLDSGGFTELKHHGRWRSTAAEFVAEIRTLVDRLGRGRGRDLAAGLDVRGGRHQWRPHQGRGYRIRARAGVTRCSRSACEPPMLGSDATPVARASAPPIAPGA
jgi:hypothetical protein